VMCQVKDCEEDATLLRIGVRPAMGSVNVNVCDRHAADLDTGHPPTEWDFTKDMPT